MHARGPVAAAVQCTSQCSQEEPASFRATVPRCVRRQLPKPGPELREIQGASDFEIGNRSITMPGEVTPLLIRTEKFLERASFPRPPSPLDLGDLHFQKAPPGSQI